MPTEIAVVLISTVVGGILGAIVNHLLASKRNAAEIEKLKAEAEKTKAETERTRAEISRYVDKSAIVSTGEFVSPLSHQNGFLSIYFPKTNTARNLRKEEVILGADRKIQLLATTGHSYLAVIGNRFKAALINRLKEGISVQIIILNPWSDGAVFLAFGEFSENKSAGEMHLAVEQMRQGQIAGFEPVSFISDSVYYRRKLSESLEGYSDLRKSFGKEIELRFVDREIVATVLMTDKSGFFEPYINVNLQERMQNLMHTFEIEFSRSSYFSSTCQAYFDTLWALSVSYDEFMRTEGELKTKLIQKYQGK